MANTYTVSIGTRETEVSAESPKRAAVEAFKQAFGGQQIPDKTVVSVANHGKYCMQVTQHRVEADYRGDPDTQIDDTVFTCKRIDD